jgi:endonuclease/exonuclease/phosphatase family metal-dependent hydrolase
MLPAAVASAQVPEVVVYTSTAKTVGNWAVVADSTAAGGARLANADRGAAKLTTALASPADYFELTFDAQAGVGYRLWMRGKAQNNSYSNDSVYLQFSDSVSSSGAERFRIGTTSATAYTLEDCSGCGVSGWGWNDNYYGAALGDLIYFGTSGTHTVRVQVREDGLSLDQFVLSPVHYAASAPGAAKADASILAETTMADVVLYPATAQAVGNWTVVADSTAATGARLANADKAAAKILAPKATPTDYFELTFDAVSGVPYRLWMRGKAQSNSYSNDSVYVQFSDSLSSGGVPQYRIGTTSATTFTLEDCSGCGVSGWGWNDNYYGAASGTLIYFATSGPHTIRVQAREDGLSLDQIVLSPGTYLSSAPGAAKNDTVIIGGGENDPPPPPPPVDPPPPPPNQPPVFEADPDGFRISQLAPALPVAPATVNLTASATGPEASDTLTYTWSFGDGTPDVTLTQTTEASRQNTPHTYTAAGTYTVTVTVTDQAMNSVSRSGSITIGAPVAPAGSELLKVMQWNTYKSRTTDTRTEGSKVWLFARWIAAANPDVVQLQEVMGTNIADQYKAELERAMPGTTWSYFYRSDANGNSKTAQGIAILTKLPILAHASIAYTNCPSAGVPQRAAIGVTVPVNGRNVTVIDTHLSSYSSAADEACRYAQAQQLRTWAESTFQQPRIITGDLNASSDERAIKYLTASYTDTWLQAVSQSHATAYPDNPATASVHTRAGRIDYVLASSNGELELVAEQVPDTRDYTNDHAIASQGKTNWAPHNYAPRTSDHETIIATFVVH